MGVMLIFDKRDLEDVLLEKIKRAQELYKELYVNMAEGETSEEELLEFRCEYLSISKMLADLGYPSWEELPIIGLTIEEDYE